MFCVGKNCRTWMRHFEWICTSMGRRWIHSVLNCTAWILTLVDDTIDYTLTCRVQLYSVDEFYKMLLFDFINFPVEMTANDSLREISNYSLYFDDNHEDNSLYEIALLSLSALQSIHWKMNNNENRLALRYRWWSLAFKCPSFHICIEMVIEPFFRITIWFSYHNNSIWDTWILQMVTGNIKTSINGHVACLKLLIKQSRLRSCHYEWIIITSDNLKRVDPLCWEHFELFSHLNRTENIKTEKVAMVFEQSNNLLKGPFGFSFWMLFQFRKISLISDFHI